MVPAHVGVEGNEEDIPAKKAVKHQRTEMNAAIRTQKINFNGSKEEMGNIMDQRV